MNCHKGICFVLVSSIGQKSITWSDRSNKSCVIRVYFICNWCLMVSPGVNGLKRKCQKLLIWEIGLNEMHVHLDQTLARNQISHQNEILALKHIFLDSEIPSFRKRWNEFWNVLTMESCAIKFYYFCAFKAYSFIQYFRCLFLWVFFSTVVLCIFIVSYGSFHTFTHVRITSSNIINICQATSISY